MTATASTKSWAPSDDDRFIYAMVKFHGESQSAVAALVGIHQGTVSRAIQRYERWQARSQPQDDGRLDHAERLRAQRWLTFERNELIVSSCLRIAREMEGVVDVSQSTTQRSTLDPANHRDIRTIHSTRDRHGLVCRFLRLAQRTNMEQLKLAEQAELPPLPPLTAEEIAAEVDAAEELREELAAARGREGSGFGVQGSGEDGEQGTRDRGQESAIEELTEREQAERHELAQEILEQHAAGVPGLEEAVALAQAELAGAHGAHNDSSMESGATADPEQACGKNGRPNKTPNYARIDPPASGNAKPRPPRRSAEPVLGELRLSPNHVGAVIETG